MFKEVQFIWGKVKRNTFADFIQPIHGGSKPFSDEVAVQNSKIMKDDENNPFLLETLRKYYIRDFLRSYQITFVRISKHHLLKNCENNNKYLSYFMCLVDLVRVRKRMRFQPQVQVVYLVRMLFSCVRIFKTITNTTTLDCITVSDTARQLISYVQRVQKPIFSTFYRFFANKIIFINKILSCLFLLCIVYQLYVSICHFKALLKNKQMPCAQLIWLILGKETGNKSASIKTYFDES